MAAAKNRRQDAREELVQHMVHVMEGQGLRIEAAGVPGRPQPKRMKRGLKRSRLAADVVARDGKRLILGIALDTRLMREPYVPKELDAHAGACRMLVICVAQESANQAIHVLFDEPMPNWRKMRLLRSPGTSFDEVSKAANDKRLRDLVRAKRETAVHVISEEQ